MHRLFPPACLTLVVCCLAVAACRQAEKPAADPLGAVRHGWDLFRSGEFDAATDAFRSAEAGTRPANPIHAAALYGEATLWNLRRPDDDRGRARQLYQQIADLTPPGSLAAWSLLDQAALLYPADASVEPDWNALAQAYQQVIDHFPDQIAGEEAFVAQQSIVLQSFDPAKTKEAVARLERFVADRPDSYFRYGALILAGCGYETLGQWRELVDARVRAAQVSDAVAARVARNPKASLMASTLNWLTNYWTIASISEFQLGDFATAREYYGRIVSRAPADPLYGAAIVALKRMDDKETEVRRELTAPP